MLFIRTLTRRLYRNRRLLFFFSILLAVEIPLHMHSLSVSRPSEPLDPPFAEHCQLRPEILKLDTALAGVHGNVSALPRENAAAIMLARNSDVNGAVTAIESFERQFNRQFQYPVVFLNDEPFDERFKAALRGATSGDVWFERTGPDLWGWPGVRDQLRWETSNFRAGGEGSGVNKYIARQHMKKMAGQGIAYAARESYHHMCRFYSGKFYDHPALQGLDYYWRLEPDILFTCRIPYDPFRLMRLTGKQYGHTIALWEVGRTSPSLFRKVIEYRDRFLKPSSHPTDDHHENSVSNSKAKANTKRKSTTQQRYTPHVLPDSRLIHSMTDASPAPLPLRWLFGHLHGWLPRDLFHSRARSGDAWNFCHYWSNFEIGSFAWLRSDAYRHFFDYLDSLGGFYYERWGDAPVHSLAAALFLKPEEIHWFADWGYVHPPFQQCPRRAKGEAKATGCQCECQTDDDDSGRRSGGVGAWEEPPDVCLRKLRQALEPR